MKVKIILIFVFLLCLVLVFLYKTQKSEQKENIIVTNYEECASAGFPIMESYPARCADGGGNVFTQDIGNEIELSDVIQLSSPRPNQVIASPLSISGSARGSWYFEATAPVYLYDGNNNLLAQGYIEATEDWMSEEFVSFKGSLIFTAADLKSGTLVFENANPSGLSENSKKLEMPVKF